MNFDCLCFQGFSIDNHREHIFKRTSLSVVFCNWFSP